MSGTSPFSKGRPRQGPPPAQPGLYRIIDAGTGIVTYIGVSSNLRRRQQEHQRSGKYDPATDVFAWQTIRSGATVEQLLSTERDKIRRHRPTDNRRGGGAGRPPLNWPTSTQPPSACTAD